MPNRKDMFLAIKNDYGEALLDDHINLVLDLYEQNPDYIERLCKDLRKQHKKGTFIEPKTRLTVQELDALNQKFKEDEQRIIESNKVSIEPAGVDYIEPEVKQIDYDNSEIKNVDDIQDESELKEVIHMLDEKFLPSK